MNTVLWKRYIPMMPMGTSHPSRKQNAYTFDELNQLVREDNSVLNQSILYAYDLGGNILEKRIYIYQPEKIREALLLCEAQKIVT